MMASHQLQPAVLFLDRIAQWTWSTSWQASLLVLLVLGLQLLGRRWLTPRWQYALWMLVVARLLLPWVPASTWSLSNVQRWFPASDASPAPAAIPFPAPEAAAVEPTPWTAKPAALAPSAPSAALPAEVWWNRHWRRMLQGLWLAGVASLLALALARQRWLSRRLQGLRPLDCPRVLGLLESCRKELGLRHSIEAYELDPWPTPAVFGGRRPRLILPTGMASDLGDSQLRLVFLHELIHVRRHDFLVNWLLILIQAWHWFNPLIWLALRRARAARELVCDALVLEALGEAQRTEYGRTLIQLAQRASRLVLCPGLMPVLGRASELKRRITFIAQPRRATRLVSTSAALCATAAGLLTFTTAAQRPQPAASASTPPAPAETPEPPASISARRTKASLERGVRVLEDELARLRERIRSKREELSALSLEAGHSGLEGVDFSRLEENLAKSRADYEQVRQAFLDLGSRGKQELAMVAVRSPYNDSPFLSRLVEQRLQAENSFAGLRDRLGSGHPQVAQALKLRETIDQQIDDKVEGIFLGLKAMMASSKAAVDRWEQELVASKIRGRDSLRQQASWAEASRELDVLERFENALRLRLERDKLEALRWDERSEHPEAEFESELPSTIRP